jgi:hexosaminidase
MKKAFHFLFFYFLFITCIQADNEYSILPCPQRLDYKSGVFRFSNRTTIFIPFSDTAFRTVAEDFKSRLEKVSGLHIKISDKTELKSPKYSVVFSINNDLKEEAYKLQISPASIQIEASTAVGAFYAVQTLYQLLPVEIYGKDLSRQVCWEIPAVDIEDSPRFAYRGVLLDVSRHFMPIDFIKQFIDVMAMYKLNRLQWHLTDDQGWRIEIKKYPRLVEIGSVRKETMVGRDATKFDGEEHKGYYTQEEAKDIVRYAAERGITIIPEIEMPGHAMAALASYPELSCGLEDTYEVGRTWGVYTQVYCPKETTFQFLEDVFSELFPIFPSEYYHIGGDECPKDSWKKCTHCQHLIKELGLKDEHELQSYFVTRMEKYLNAHGKQIIGWDEILQGGLAPNATVTVRNGEETCKEVANSGHDVIVTYAYLDYYQEHELCAEEVTIPGGFLSLEQTYKYIPVPELLTPENKKHIFGVESCLWTEYIATPERLLRQAFPRLFAFAEVGWGTAVEKDYPDFCRRVLTGFKQLEQKGMQYSDSFFNPLFTFDKWWVSEYPKDLSLSVDYPKAEIRYTTDGSDPTAQSFLYVQKIAVNKGDIIRAGAFVNGKLIGKIRAVKFN